VISLPPCDLESALDGSPPLSPLWDEEELPSYDELMLTSLCENIRSITSANSNCNSTGGYGSSEGEAEYILNHALLFSVLGSEDDFEPVVDNSVTMKDELREVIHTELHDILSEVYMQYDDHDCSLLVKIGGSPDFKSVGTCELGYRGMPCIRELSIVVAHSVKNAKYYHMALSILAWMQSSHSGTIETITILLPDHLALPNEDLKAFRLLALPDALPTGKIFPFMHTLNWSGNLDFLPKFVPLLVSQAVKVLRINSELSIDDALLLLRQYSSSLIQELEITTLIDQLPTLLPEYNENIKISGDHNLLPFTLPNLDTLKLGSCVSFNSLFDTLVLPSLCKLELDLNRSDTESDEHQDLLHSALVCPLMSQDLLYVNVELDSNMDNTEHVARLFNQKLPSAYVLVNGVASELQ